MYIIICIDYLLILNLLMYCEYVDALCYNGQVTFSSPALGNAGIVLTISSFMGNSILCYAP